MLVLKLLTRFIKRSKRSNWNRSLHTWHQWALHLTGETTEEMTGMTEMMTGDVVRKVVQVVVVEDTVERMDGKLFPLELQADPSMRRLTPTSSETSKQTNWMLTACPSGHPREVLEVQEDLVLGAVGARVPRQVVRRQRIRTDLHSLIRASLVLLSHMMEEVVEEGLEDKTASKTEDMVEETAEEQVVKTIEPRPFKLFEILEGTDPKV